MSGEKSLVQIVDGKEIVQSLLQFNVTQIQVVPGARYGVVEQVGERLVLAQDVVAIREGTTLHLVYDDSQISFQGFYDPEAEASVDLPSDISGAARRLESAEALNTGGTELLHVQGEGRSLLSLAAQQNMQQSDRQETGFDDSDSEDGSIWSDGILPWLGAFALGIPAAALLANRQEDTGTDTTPTPIQPTAVDIGLASISVTQAENPRAYANLKQLYASGDTIADTTPTLRGTLDRPLESGQKLEIYDGGLRLGTADVNGTSWTFTDDGRALTNGDKPTYLAQVINNSGNKIASSAAFTLNIDTAITSAPSGRHTVGITQDTGASASDRITNDENVQITLNLGQSPTLANDERLEVSANDGTSWIEAKLVGDPATSKTWQTANGAVPLTDGSGLVRARIVDNAGNASELTLQGNDYKLDKSITSVQAANHTVTITTDSGYLSTDRHTNDDKVQVGVTLAAPLTLQSDETFQISADNGTTWIDLSILDGSEGRTWQTLDNEMILFAPPAIGATAEITGTFTARIIDVAGNVQAVSLDNDGANPNNNTYKFDNLHPGRSVNITSILDDTGSSANDYITTDSDGLVIHLTLDQNKNLDGNRLEYRVDQGEWVDITFDNRTQTPDANKGHEMTFADSQLTGIDGTQQEYNLQFRVSDAAGNTSGTVGQQKVVVDRQISFAPAGTHTVLIAADSSPASGGTPALQSDKITNEREVTVTLELGTPLNLAADEIFQVSQNGVNWTQLNQATGSATGLTWESATKVPLSGTTASQVEGAFTARILDTAGNVRLVPLNSANYAFDGVAPIQAKIPGVAAVSFNNDTGPVSDANGPTHSDDITSDSLVQISLKFNGNFSLETGSFEEKLQISADGGNTWHNMTKSGSTITESTWQTEVNRVQLAEGAGNTLQARLVDLAGNTTAVALDKGSLTLDTAAPVTTIAINSLGDDSRPDSHVQNNDFITNDNNGVTIQATLSVGLGTGERLEYSSDNGTTWTDISNSVAGTTISHIDNTLTKSAIVQMRVVDIAGNVGAVASQALVIDTATPTKTISIEGITPDGGAVNDFMTKSNTGGLEIQATLSELLQAGEIVEYSTDGTTWIDITSAVSGGTRNIRHTDTSLTTNLDREVKTVQMRVVDAAGNEGAIATQNITIDNKITQAVAGVHTIKIDSDTLPESFTAKTNPDEASDHVTRTPSMNITLTLAVAQPALDAVDNEVFQMSADGGINWVTATTIDGGKTWVSSKPVSLSTGVDQKVIARITDGAGNESRFEIQNSEYTLDIAAPTTTVSVLGISENTGVQNDFVTSDSNGLTISIALSQDLKDDEILEYSIDGTEWLEVGEITTTDGVNTFTAENLIDSTTLCIRVSDLAGNVGPVSKTPIIINSKGFLIEGQAENEFSGRSVSSAGDVNGDGLDDIIVGAYGADPASGVDAGKSYVIYGKNSGETAKLVDIEAGTGGFVITGEAAGDLSGYSVSGAGDVNGDGFADVIVGARYADQLNKTDSGKSYVVFGSAKGAAVDLKNLGASGFKINGEGLEDFSGWSVSNAGDVNGDGLADLIVGSYEADATDITQPNANIEINNSGKSYVIFGKDDDKDINLVDISAGQGGFVINGGEEEAYSGWSVSYAGDVNGDGLDDVLVGAYAADFAVGADTRQDAGKTYVVFGKADTAAVELNLANFPNNANATGGGFVIIGQEAHDQTGWSVSTAGDLNGDGLADLLIGAREADTPTGNAGKTYVVFGQNATGVIDLATIDPANGAGVGGFAIHGESDADLSGFSVAVAGDVNGDGNPDLIVGTPSADRAGTSSADDSGKSYVVFGTGAATNRINLADITDETKENGFVIVGANAGDRSGISVSSAGDINGDGLDDLIIGAHNADPTNAGNAGRSYVVFGKTDGKIVDLKEFGGPGARSVDFIGTEAADTLVGASGNEIIQGGGGNDKLSGGGGTDVLLGGEGDDEITVNQSNVTALNRNFDKTNDANLLAKVDGGLGLDTLLLDTAGVDINLSSAISHGQIENIEVLDLSGNVQNTLTLTSKDVFMLGEYNLFNDANGWAGFDADRVERTQLVIKGDAAKGPVPADRVDIDATFTDTGTDVTGLGGTYSVYNGTVNGADLQLLIDVDVTVV